MKCHCAAKKSSLLKQSSLCYTTISMLSYHTRRSLGEDYEEITRPKHIDGVWLHGAEVTNEEVERAIEQYQLDGNIVRDVFDNNELPRVEYDERATLYMFLRIAWHTREGEVKTAPLLAVAGKDSYVTLSRTKQGHPAQVTEKRPHIRPEDTVLLLLSTFATVVSEYEELIRHTSDTVRRIKRRMRKHEATNNDFLQFITVEENLATYSYNLTAMLSVAERLRDDHHSQFKPKHLEALDDIMLHTRQLLANVSSSTGAVASIQSVYSTIANNTLNQRMKLLTIITLLVTVPNVFYGMYGMNVVLPFAREPWAYGAVVGFTVIIMLFVVLFVKRSKLL